MIETLPPSQNDWNKNFLRRFGRVFFTARFDQEKYLGSKIIPGKMVGHVGGLFSSPENNQPH